MRHNPFASGIGLRASIIIARRMSTYLGNEAREKMEAGPFVEQFAKKCEQHIANGNLAAAKGDLEKARSLDPDHPKIKEIEKRVMSASGKWPAARPAGAPPAPPQSSST